MGQVLHGSATTTKTAISDKAAPCPLDKVNRQFQAPAPNRLWVSDFIWELRCQAPSGPEEASTSAA